MHRAVIPLVVIWPSWCSATLGTTNTITYPGTTKRNIHANTKDGSDVCMVVHQTIVQGITPATLDYQVSWSVYTSYTEVSTGIQVIELLFWIHFLFLLSK